VARLVVFACVVALGVAAALNLISERGAIINAGYRVAEREAERRKLVELNRKLEAQVAALKTPGALAHRVKELQLGLLPPAESLEQRLEREREEAERRKTRHGSPVARNRR